MKLRKAIGLMLLFTASLSGLGSCSMTGPQGSQGEQSIQGQPGKDGSSLLTGNGKPDSNLGKNGDSYIDLDTWNYYIKTNAVWVLEGNIKAGSKDHDGTEGLEFYPINDTECAVAAGKAKLLKEIIIPSKYKNYTVTTIDSSAFASCKSLVSITIPDSVTSIGGSAFAGCSSLTSITIPDSVTSIGSSAFASCKSLVSITIPDSVTSIGEWTFEYCSNLTSIEIPNSVTSIGEHAFYECSSLTSIEIPSSVTSISRAAFCLCSSLTSITIPFVGNTLNGTSNAHFGYIFGASAYYDYKLYVPSTLKEVIVTGGSSICSDAFALCSSLTSIIIPESVTSIGGTAFAGCSSLTIYCEAESQPSGWNSSWNRDKRPVYWAGEWEYDADGNPTPII